MSSNRAIRAGVIGCGQFMSRQHIQTIARSPHLQLQHLADLDEHKLAHVADCYRPIRRSTRWQDVVADPEVDAVVIGVVPRFHAEMARAALEHGKPVYVEKPLALTPEECLAIQRLARARRLPVAVGFNRRFAPATEHLRRAFQAARSPVSVFYRISDDDRVRPPEQQWKKEDRLLLEVVHIFDLLGYLLEAEPIRIYACEARFNDALVTIEYENGSRATIHSSSYGSLAQSKEHLEAVLDRGAVEMDDFVELRATACRPWPPWCVLRAGPTTAATTGTWTTLPRGDWPPCWISAPATLKPWRPLACWPSGPLPTPGIGPESCWAILRCRR